MEYGENMWLEMWFKCMPGFTTDNAKFIMPIQEKMTYRSSFDRCDGFGFTNPSNVLI